MLGINGPWGFPSGWYGAPKKRVIYTSAMAEASISRLDL